MMAGIGFLSPEKVAAIVAEVIPPEANTSAKCKELEERIVALEARVTALEPKPKKK